MRASRGIEGRLGGRLQALGYWKDGRPDVSRFCVEKGYLPQYVYAWLKGRVPGAANLVRLGTDLGGAPGWLLFGDRPRDGWIAAEVRQLIRPETDSSPGSSPARKWARPPGETLPPGCP